MFFILNSRREARGPDSLSRGPWAASFHEQVSRGHAYWIFPVVSDGKMCHFHRLEKMLVCLFHKTALNTSHAAGSCRHLCPPQVILLQGKSRIEKLWVASDPWNAEGRPSLENKIIAVCLKENRGNTPLQKPPPIDLIKLPALVHLLHIWSPRLQCFRASAMKDSHLLHVCYGRFKWSRHSQSEVCCSPFKDRKLTWSTPNLKSSPKIKIQVMYLLKNYI